MEWIKVKRDNYDIEKGHNLCPKCNKDTLEKLVDDGYDIKERCSNGCFIFNFKTMKYE